MNDISQRYPRTVEAGGTTFELRTMTAADEAALLDFALTLPTHDVLFLPRDIRQPKVLSAWVRELERGHISSLLALRDGVVVGCSAIARDPLSFSPHVGDLRVILAPAARERGLGRVLIQESFLVAIALGLEKLTAHMTGDRTAAINVFEDMGFRPEAWLRDHVRDEAGTNHDIVILGLDVRAQQAKQQLYGVADAFEG
jgi:RimJ/RimL family protein N-acetyltransferase